MSSLLSGEQLVHLQAKTNYELPSNGLKEFEPTNSWLEQKQIQSALDERKTLLEEERVEKWSLLMEAEWIPHKHKAEVKRKNKHWEVFGHHSDGKDWLFPEEVLYLMEMNCLECHYGQVPLSIQKGYTVLLRPESGCSITEYRVFSHLSRAGYRVMRHLPNLTVTAYERQIRLDQHLEQKTTYSDDIARPDLPPKTILDLSDNVEVLIKANDPPLDREKEKNSKDSSSTSIEKQKSPVKASIEVIDLLDSSSEESADESSDDSDIEFIKECKSTTTNNGKSNQDFMNLSVNCDDDDDDDDDDDSDIIEIPVLKKEIIVATIESSDSEDEENNTRESDSEKSDDGNWKRRQTNKEKQQFVRPATMNGFKYLAIEEFCLEKKVKTEKNKECTQNNHANDGVRNEQNESVDSSDSIEFLSIEPRKLKTPFTVCKSRNEILDMIPSMAKQRIMTVESPDLRLIPDSIKPKQHVYTYNTNSFKARLFSSFRPGYRGRRHFSGSRFNNSYNPYHSNNTVMSNFNSNELTMRAPLLPNPMLSQMFGTDLESVARGVMQFASALLINNMSNTPAMLGNSIPPLNNQTNGSLPHNFQLNQVGLLNNTPTYPSPGLNSRFMYNQQPRSSSGPTHIRFSDSPETLDEEAVQPSGNNRFGYRDDLSRNSEYPQRPSSAQPRRDHEHNGYGAFRSRPFGRNRSDRNHFGRNRSGSFTPQRTVEGSQNNGPVVDPAYVRPDVPIPRENNSERNTIPPPKANNKPIEVIDILDDDNDNFVPLRGISNHTRKRKLTKEMIKKRFGKKKKFQNRNKNKEKTVIFIDSPKPQNQSVDLPVKEEIPDASNVDASNVSNINIKTEPAISETATIKQEILKPCKQEPGEDNLRVENSTNEIHIKKEPSNEVRVKREEESLLNNIDSLPTVKSEPGVSSREIEVKTEISAGNSRVKIEENGRLTMEPLPSTSRSVNEDPNSMDVSNENSNVNNLVLTNDNSGTSEASTNNLSENVNTKDSSCDRVKNWAEVKKHNVTLGRQEEESRDEVDSSSEEDGNEIQPLIRPKHCKTIGTVLKALQIFRPFSANVSDVTPKLKISFDMYLATDFRKAHRTLPHYRICIFGGMDSIPSPAQFHELQTRFKDSVPLLRAVVMPNSVVFYNCSPVSLPVHDHSYK